MTNKIALLGMFVLVMLLSGMIIVDKFPRSCAPKFEWIAGNTQRGLHERYQKPFFIRRARVVPLSERPYDMTITAAGGGLVHLGIHHAAFGQATDPQAWQLKPNGIAYRAVYPVGIIAVLIVADDPDAVTLSEPEFECL